MNTSKAINLLRDRAKTGFDIYERRPEKYQLIVPICHEDGDMVDIYLQDSPKGENYIRICDFGMAVMRLSYTYEINTDSRQRIFDSILINRGVCINQAHTALMCEMARIGSPHTLFIIIANCKVKTAKVRYVRTFFKCFCAICL